MGADPLIGNRGLPIDAVLNHNAIMMDELSKQAPPWDNIKMGEQGKMIHAFDSATHSRRVALAMRYIGEYLTMPREHSIDGDDTKSANFEHFRMFREVRWDNESKPVVAREDLKEGLKPYTDQLRLAGLFHDWGKVISEKEHGSFSKHEHYGAEEIGKLVQQCYEDMDLRITIHRNDPDNYYDPSPPFGWIDDELDKVMIRTKGDEVSLWIPSASGHPMRELVDNDAMQFLQRVTAHFASMTEDGDWLQSMHKFIWERQNHFLAMMAREHGKLVSWQNILSSPIALIGAFNNAPENGINTAVKAFQQRVGDTDGDVVMVLNRPLTSHERKMSLLFLVLADTMGFSNDGRELKQFQLNHWIEIMLHRGKSEYKTKEHQAMIEHYQQEFLYLQDYLNERFRFPVTETVLQTADLPRLPSKEFSSTDQLVAHWARMTDA